jgi:phosphoribosylaminoimidazolecarboxamide formyltransferase/IMP cyclohydrolase
MTKKINSALISVFYKDGLDVVVRQLHELGISIYSTGGTQQYIEKLDIPCIPVEQITTYPSILGGRVKTLHPSVFGGILGRRDMESDVFEMTEYKIPEIDLVMVDLYPFEETLANTLSANFKGTQAEAEKSIIEKIDIGGPSMIRAAAKNFKDVLVIASKSAYPELLEILEKQNGETTLEQRKKFAGVAFEIVAGYDLAIHNYFQPENEWKVRNSGPQQTLRYGENPHQKAIYHGDFKGVFNQLHGKEISYNNLVDIDAAIQLIKEFSPDPGKKAIQASFVIIKHTNPCGVATRNSVAEAWQAALAGDPESAFGGVLITNGIVDLKTAELINEIFFEVLIAPSFDQDALDLLKQKKNRILLQLAAKYNDEKVMYKSVLNGCLEQEMDHGNFEKWDEVGGRNSTVSEQDDLAFANLLSKHLKSNAIALVKNKQLIGKGCGQTSRIDALRQAIAKSKQFEFSLQGAVLASDAFFPFDDCVKIAHAEGIEAFIQPGGSIRDKDSIAYCKEKKLAMILTGMRHFRH